MKVIELPGNQFVKWLFSLLLDHKNPLDMVRQLFESTILITELEKESEKNNETQVGFIAIPNCDCDNCAAIKKIVLAGIEENKTEKEIKQAINLYKTSKDVMH